MRRHVVLAIVLALACTLIVTGANATPIASSMNHHGAAQGTERTSNGFPAVRKRMIGLVARRVVSGSTA